MADPRAAADSARFGIQGKGIYGMSTPRLRALAREIGKDHRLAQQLWETGSHSARHLAVMIDDPALVTEAQTACWNFFDRTPLAWRKALAWTQRRPEFERRAGYVKKSVNWALREIGKRSRALNRAAIRTAKAIRRQDTPSARWVAADALRELTSPAVQRRLAR